MGGLPANQTVYTFVLNPKDPQVLYVGMKDGVYKSQDSGQSWNRVGEGLHNVATLAIHPETGVLYAGSSDGKVFKSSDGGAHWEATN